jgi:hypothetical protein
VAVQSRGSDIRQLCAEIAGRQGAIAEEGLNDSEPDRMEEEISACHRASQIVIISESIIGYENKVAT